MKRWILAAVVSMAPAFAAHAAQYVTYTWHTTSQGFGGANNQSPTATFDAPLAEVQAGKIIQSDVTNIQMSYSGLSFTNYGTSGLGSDFAGYVDPTTGAEVYHDSGQGFALFASKGSGNDYSDYLSILFDYAPSGSSVGDSYNAGNNQNGTVYAGYPTSGFWTAAFPAADPGDPGTGAVPEPVTWAMMVGGFGVVGAAMRRRKADARFA